MRLVDSLFLPIALLMILDSMVTTPIALAFVPGTIEANPIHSNGYEKYGIGYFFLVTPVTLTVVFLIMRGSESLLDSLFSVKKYNKLKKHKDKFIYLFFIGLAITLSWTVLGNSSIIFKYLIQGG